MTAPRFDALAGRLVARVQSGATDAPPAAEDRARAIRLIEAAIRRRNRMRVATLATFAAAAVVLLGLGAAYLAGRRAPLEAASALFPRPSQGVTVVGHPTGGGAIVVETGSRAPLADGKSLSAGSRISARPGGHFVLSVSTGTRLTVEEGGEVSIVDSGADEVFALHAGAVRADVAKLTAGQRFIIRTPDSEVEVRGTSFRVAMAEPDPACEGGTVTRVNVYEGVVSVRHAGQEARIAAGQHWPSGCVPKAAVPALHQEESHLIGAQARTTPPEAPSVSRAPQVDSDLGEQNDAFAQAFAAKRRGATAEAVAGFERFVSRYPSSSLVESALAQRMQLLGGVDRARARAAAEQYLARYPKGFARTDAEAIERRGP
jgi:hypothetical protein